MWYSVHHFTTIFSKKSPPAVFEPRPDNVGCCPHAEAQHGLGGARNMTVSVSGSDSIMSQHIHMLTPGLPVFCSAAPTLVPMKVRSTWWWDETGKALLSGHLAGFLVRTQVHMFSCLFVRICLHATCSNKIMGIEGIAKWLAHAGLVLRGAHLSSLGGEVCDGWSCASQLHCAGSSAANHASTRLRIHVISCFTVMFFKHHGYGRLVMGIAGLSWRGGLWCMQLR